MPGRTRAENIQNHYDPRQEIEAYKSAIREFANAMGRLTEAWERLDFAGVNVPTDDPSYAGEAYPFTQSFDELYHAVLGWAHDIEAAEPAAWGAPATAVTSAEIVKESQKVVAQYRTRQAALKRG